MDFEATLQYLFDQLPMYQRVGAVAFKKDLTNTIKLCELLGNPHHHLKAIHIAGTNGKGSVAHALAAVFTQAGFKTGLYISPHYKDFRERIKINGEYIPKEDVVRFVAENKLHFEKIQPSFFEMTVAMAFWHFAEQQTDFAVIETGLGGRLDSTNIIQPFLSVITNISYDHTAMLGNTYALIAQEKAGIIKLNTPVVIGETHPETEPVFRKKAAEMNAPVFFADQNICVQNFQSLLTKSQLDVFQNNELIYTSLQTDLTGSYQSKNIATIIQTTELLPSLGFDISRQTVAKALQKVKSLTRFKGRWQILSEANPLIIADSAHNEAGISYVVSQLSELPHRKLHIVFGAVNDKDLHSIFTLLPVNAAYYFCKADVPRGLPAAELKQQAEVYGLKGLVYNSVNEAFRSAKFYAHSDDIIFVGGSIFVVAEVIE
ncbi:MAG: bifunctional folylpolyglutamate synthase/dihydrofolate synthase [Sphingobacteriales bacterium]|nr:MAG: bifunctional folylpolyglutamate synthase/dihydrofolate synthase [Sphingobacteriales bacterium]